jgi:hypothetical protein
MRSVAQQLTLVAMAGGLESVISCFEKDCALIAQIGKDLLAFSVNRHRAFTVFDEILPKIPPN